MSLAGNSSPLDENALYASLSIERMAQLVQEVIFGYCISWKPNLMAPNCLAQTGLSSANSNMLRMKIRMGRMQQMLLRMVKIL